MIKSLGMLKRKKGLTREQFVEHWEKVHAPLFLSKNPPGLRKYIQNHPAKGAEAEFTSDVDGIAELWFDDAESLKALYQWMHSSDEIKDLREDTELYVNVEEHSRFVAEEHVLKELSEKMAKSNMIKSLGLLKRKKGLTREQFLEHWEKVHAPLFLSKNPPGLRKYIQDHPAKGAEVEFETDIDGIAELWFDDVESLQAFYQWLQSADEAKDLWEDNVLYVNFEEQSRFVAEGHVLKG